MSDARYIYGSAAPKVGYYDRALVQEESRRQSFEVIPGGSRSRQNSPSYTFAMRAAKIALAAIIVFACIGFGRITLASATVGEAVQANAIKSDLAEIRSDINDMQAERSSLSNPVRIKDEAVALGMVNPEETYVIELEQDVVKTGDDGALSLTGSLGSL